MSNFIFVVVLGNMLNYDKRYFVIISKYHKNSNMPITSKKLLATI